MLVREKGSDEGEWKARGEEGRGRVEHREGGAMRGDKIIIQLCTYMYVHN